MYNCVMERSVVILDICPFVLWVYVHIAWDSPLLTASHPEIMGPIPSNLAAGDTHFQPYQATFYRQPANAMLLFTVTQCHFICLDCTIMSLSLHIIQKMQAWIYPWYPPLGHVSSIWYNRNFAIPFKIHCQDLVLTFLSTYQFSDKLDSQGHSIPHMSASQWNINISL